jgi:hypothetical protein
VKLWATLVAALLLAGCAGQEPARPDPDVAALTTPLIGGLSQIRDKAIDPPDIDRLFAGGLEHLSAIDPDLHAAEVGDDITLSLAELTIARAARSGYRRLGGDD